MAKYKQIQIDVDVYRIIEGQRIAFSETENDILKRLLASPASSAVAKPDVTIKLSTDSTAVQRSRGNWEITYKGKRGAAANMIDAYRSLLLALANDDSGFLARFAEERSRSRRYVSKDPSALYDKSPQLAKDHARELIAGWYVDTNLSKEQVVQRLKAAARVANLTYGIDVQISENGIIIGQ
ncbi:hypothetical protein [Sphingomonas cavernae]|uniref:Uncharacterized protein n=1 Tax=Sphingomonas cavernae TaxID=2320861 RepID=A0A418WRR5_9SPHN|nr:hypothetical protein [Sphingomonas cavernae]RJF93896.1 hypothetical protein D3876_06340 [Sphingomonas cavernae]